jgi:hypothetical protein
MDDLIR